MAIQKFKVGDKVRIINKEYIVDHQDEKISNGVIAKIEKGDEGGWMNYTFQNGYGNSYQDNHLELVEEDKKVKFKVGDLVRISIPRDDKDWKLDGILGEVVDILKDDDYPISIEMKEKYQDTNKLQFKEYELELMPLMHN